MDVTTLIGIAVGFASVLAGQALEGGHIGSIVQLTAAIIVLGGTIGAVVAQFPLKELVQGVSQSRYTLLDPGVKLAPLAKQLTEIARRSRKEGLLAVEKDADRTKDPFLRQALQGLVDGHTSTQLRYMLETAIEQEEQTQQHGPRMFEAAGGYAPTLGILGAVLGLIHVMENLSDPSKLGSGIAVAFVATVYGVGASNLVFLPLSQKLRMKLETELRRRELILEGVCAIQEGVNPSLIEKRLSTYVDPSRGA